jgi:hypothetical protein
VAALRGEVASLRTAMAEMTKLQSEVPARAARDREELAALRPHLRKLEGAAPARTYAAAAAAGAAAPPSQLLPLPPALSTAPVEAAPPKSA